MSAMEFINVEAVVTQADEKETAEWTEKLDAIIQPHSASFRGIAEVVCREGASCSVRNSRG